MKNKVLLGIISTCVILGGAIAVGASNSFRNDDSNHQEDRETVAVTKEKGSVNQIADNKAMEVELEEEHGQTFYKVKQDDDHVSSQSSSLNTSITREKAIEIAQKEVNGTVSKIEMEREHGRLEYKIEIQSSNGEADVRIDAETGKVTRVDRDDN